jgi:hypothetical protein
MPIESIAENSNNQVGGEYSVSNTLEAREVPIEILSKSLE